MSLKNFHLVFVSVCLLMFAFLGVWAFFLNPEPSAVYDMIGWLGVVGVAASLAYGVFFHRKSAKSHI